MSVSGTDTGLNSIDAQVQACDVALLLDQALNGLEPLDRFCDGLTAFGLDRFKLNIGIEITTND